MSLVFYLIHPRTPGIVGGQIDAGPAAVRLNGVELTQAAAVGEAATSSIEFDDPGGTLDVTGLWSFRVDDNSLSVGSNSALYFGFVGDRTYARGEGDSLRLGAARRIGVDLFDLNAFLGFRMLTDSDANRPAETAAARLAWLLADSYAPFHDHGNVTYPTNAMDANDYRGRYFADVLADIAAISGYNYWLDVRQSDGQVSLFFGDFNTSTAYGSPLRISNVYSDVTADASGWTYPPYIDAVGKMSASRVASGVYLPWSGGNTFVRSQATASNFNFRDLVAPMATVHSNAQATVIANRFLTESATEDESATVTIRVPISALPMIRHGMRMQAKFSHVPGWESFRWARITRQTLIQDEDTDETVRLRLELSPQGVDIAKGVVQWAEASSGLNAPYEVVLDNDPTEGNILVALWYPRTSPGPAPTSIEGVTAWNLDINGDAYDATQYGGPGNPAYLYAYSRVAGAGESRSVTVTPGILQSSCIIIELTGFSYPPAVTSSEATVSPGGSLSITDASVAAEGILLVAWAMQRTTYADPDSVAPNSGVTELYDTWDNANFAPHRWVAYKTQGDTGGSLTVTGSPANNAELNKWAVYAVGYTFE